MRQICFATCFDEKVLAELRALDGKALQLEPVSEELKFSEVAAAEVKHSRPEAGGEADVPTGLSIVKKKWAGKYAIGADDFTPDLVRGTRQGRDAVFTSGRLSTLQCTVIILHTPVYLSEPMYLCRLAFSAVGLGKPTQPCLLHGTVAPLLKRPSSEPADFSYG